MADQQQIDHARKRIALDFDLPVARVTFDNPPLNIIDLPLMDQLTAALAQIEGRADISVVLIRGEGKCFSAGVDVAAHDTAHVVAMIEKFHAVIRALVASRKVTIGEIQGLCLGGGAEIAMVCDLVYTSADAQWGFPEIQLGCFPPVAVTALAALVPPKLAAELIFTGKTISGVEAQTIGLATQSVRKEELGETVEGVLDRLRQLSPAALAVTKKAVYAWDAIHLDKGLARAEKIYLEELMQTEDAQEGIRAFLEKRNPQWKNR